MFDDALHIAVAELEGELVLTLDGDIDMASCEQLNTAITEGRRMSRHLVLDVADVEFIDSSGLNVLVQHTTSITSTDGTLRLRNVPPQMLRLLTMTGLLGVIQLDDPAADR
jgi:anti-sigma B factor antagonist